MKLATTLFALCTIAALPRAHADDEIDVKNAELLDVVETSDGSIWKGVIVEQTPNVSYKVATADGSLHVIKAADVVKISRQRNKDAHARVTADTTESHDGGVSRRYEGGGGGLPAPFAKTGLRLDPSLAIVIPTGGMALPDTSFAPSVKAGYELMLGNFGLEGGAMTRYTWWRIPGDTKAAAWTLETMPYAQAALHVSRVSVHAGVAAGLDTNYVYFPQVDMAKTKVSFGMNVQGGVDVAATENIDVHAGFDFHPATDTVIDGLPGSISYYAILFGAGVRL